MISDALVEKALGDSAVSEAFCIRNDMRTDRIPWNTAGVRYLIVRAILTAILPSIEAVVREEDAKIAEMLADQCSDPISARGLADPIAAAIRGRTHLTARS